MLSLVSVKVYPAVSIADSPGGIDVNGNLSVW